MIWMVTIVILFLCLLLLYFFDGKPFRPSEEGGG
jgi:hypothetical protein